MSKTNSDSKCRSRKVRRSWFKTRRIKKKIQYLFELIRYKGCLYTGKPYFGPVIAAAQAWKYRKPYMNKIVELEVSKLKGERYEILEIGSWAGDSAILWANAIKKFNNGNGSVTCVDQWKPYIDLGKRDKASPVISRMEKALVKERIFNLFLHNIATSKLNDIIRPYKGSSDEVLITLRDNRFNLAFVDGSHAYSHVIRDLENCRRLLCDGGILCGDDLELQKHEVDVKVAEENKDIEDCIQDPKTGEYFHPGVTLAVGEFFGGEVSCFEGFWVARKTNSGWQRVNLA